MTRRTFVGLEIADARVVAVGSACYGGAVTGDTVRGVILPYQLIVSIERAFSWFS